MINNPFIYIDPTGEILELTGSKEDRDRALALLADALGPDAAKHLSVEYDGGHYYVKYTDPSGAKGGEFGKSLSELIDSSTVAELKISYSDVVKLADGSTERLSKWGGAYTGLISKDHIQIFIKADAEKFANKQSEAVGDIGTDGNRLGHNMKTIVSHEIGHAWGAIKDNTYQRYNSTYKVQLWARLNLRAQNNDRAVQVENYTRQRLGLPLRLKH